jgi:haloacetate dehalogenase
MWRKIVPLLTPHFQLVMPDLRGYGDSDKPLDGYDKRTMARDIRELARHLGHPRIHLCGHDRGARVCHRYALDHGNTLTGVMLVDIVPTRTFFDRLTRQTAQGTWHWFFLPVADLAETLIGADPEAVLRHFLRSWAGHPQSHRGSGCAGIPAHIPHAGDDPRHLRRLSCRNHHGLGTGPGR